jgi:hypothetical protein
VHLGPVAIVQFAIGCLVEGVVTSGGVKIVENPIIFMESAKFCNLKNKLIKKFY